MFVRKFNAGDWHEYKAIRLEALRLHPDVYGDTYENMASREDSEWKMIVSGHNSAFFGLYDNNVLIGSSGIFLQDEASKTGVLIGGYIRKEYRGQKLSRLLYQARIDWARESGLFDRLVIGHKKGNEASRRANQAFGFIPIGEIEYKFGDGQTAINLQYEMRLR